MSKRTSVPLKVWPVLLVLFGLIGVAILMPDVTRVRADATENYIVLYKQEVVPAEAAATIANAGGTLVKSYDQIGVVIARSDNSSFRELLLNDTRIEDAAATTRFGVKVSDQRTSTEESQLGNLLNVLRDIETMIDG